MGQQTGGLSFEQLEVAFQHGNFAPLYFLYGEESFLIDTLQQLLIEHALPPELRAFNLDIVYGDETEARAVLGLCQSLPVMAPHRVVIVRNFDSLRENRLFAAYAERPNPQAIVLLACSGRPNLNAQPYRALRQHAVWAELRPLRPAQVPGWLARYAEREGYRLEPEALQRLAEYVGTDLQAGVQELRKLFAYAGTRHTLTLDDIVTVSGQTRSYNIFELQRAVGEGRYSDAVYIVEQLLQHASNPRSEALRIVSFLTTFFTKLWRLTLCQGQRLSNQALAGRIGVPAYFLQEYLQSARRYGGDAIRRVLAALLAADVELKGGSQRDPRLVLHLLLRQVQAACRAPLQQAA
ncbi:DNA polymerase III subunit delta [Rhodothermus marinus]|uniref:DNA polymerase III subunit delta n=1 Tax=Rhodothermus marinus (strain ATCC 43812 / DSM 4252 / R-10) TaxID=518766 RepID=D0MG12_RHOM4|nr:DNA polymerase III subunit delta [Rhodothermus marinus]ACY49501.1 DNA polymerase III, delta subunit [Rhodothermus marinus DSM 4252]